MSKNILIVIDSLGMGGAEQVVLTLGREFVNLGHTVDLILINDIVDIDVPENIVMHQLGFKKSFLDYMRYARKLHSMINTIAGKYSDGFDLILVNLQQSTRLMKRYRHANIFHVVHNTLSRTSLKNRKGIRLYLKKRSLQKIYDNLKLITVSRGVAEDLINVVGIYPKSLQNIYNPVNIDSLRKRADQPIDLNIDNYIIHVGRFDIQKRHDRLLRAFVKSGIAMPLVLVGEGHLKKEIEKEIEELGLKNQVVMTGMLKNPYPLIAHANALVLSSDYEGLSMVIIEALILGTPVVSTDCPSGPGEILTGELSQYLVPINDETALGEKIKEVSENGYDIPESIIKRFDSRKIVQDYLALIQT
jgi:glycosyltransferase involved in cell wall biosynthesis